MAQVSSDVRSLLDQHPWEETIPRLLLYALREARKRSWQGIMGGHMPSGKEAQDLVQEAVEDLLTGQRAWDPARQPDVFAHLRSIVDSKLSHLVESHANRWVRSASALAEPDDDTHTHTSHALEQLPDTASALQEALIQAEEERQAEEFFWGFYAFLAREPSLQHVIKCLLDDIDQPAERAKYLEITVQEYNNLRKKLQRRLREYQSTRGHYSPEGEAHYG